MILNHRQSGAPSLRRSALVAVAFAALVALRLPSLAQPGGADQEAYAYVGQRLLAGEQPYRDAWDQKPPGIHFLYARSSDVSFMAQPALAAWLMSGYARTADLHDFEIWTRRR